MLNALELLSVDLWREIFDYFNVNDLWYSFRNLNKNIDTIIDQTILHLNFKKPNKYGYFKENILPLLNIANVRSLKFEDKNEIKHFFSKYSLNSMVQLRLLSLNCMYSFNDQSFTFWSQLASLKYLRILNIKLWGNLGPNNSIEEKEFIIRSIFNKDYCPLLKFFFIDSVGRQRYEEAIPSLISTSKTTNITYLTLDTLVFPDLIKLLPALQNVKVFHLDYQLYYNDRSNKQQQQKLSFTIPLMLKCLELHLKLSEEIMFEHIEYILKHTPNVEDLFLWGWDHLLNARKWELLLLNQCPKLRKFELICTGLDANDNFYEAIENFEQECQRTPFWRERNMAITDEDRSGHDYRSDFTIRFNI